MRPHRLVCVIEPWGIYCSALKVTTDSLPQKSAAKVRQLIKQSDQPRLLFPGFRELSSKAHRAGISFLPCSLYKQGQSKSAGWHHLTLKTKTY